jgi:actin-like ATPase involved in cell morphogenesis
MKIIGVDLGTTNSCVYQLDDAGTPVLVLANGKYKIFPSAAWSGGPGKDIVIGHAAKARVGQQPPPILAVKRMMGTTETVMLGGKPATPVEVSAHILRFVRRQVEEASSDQVGGVIITVPAYFDAAPKNDTYQAAVQAFYDGDTAMAHGRIELQLEPEAAAYAYAAEDPADRLRVLVYDFGGGTFDVTVLEKSREAGLTVLKFGGDPHLGGDNVDDRLASWLLYLLRGGRADLLDRILEPGRYETATNYTLLQRVLAGDPAVADDLRAADRELMLKRSGPVALDLDYRNQDDLARIQVMKRLAEAAKLDLTTSPEAVVAKQGAFADQNGETVDVDLIVTRSDFDRLIGDMMARTIECTTDVLARAGATPDSIDRILLVGGSSRMPIVRQSLERIFNRPIQLTDPDLIVARGAAIRARSMTPPPLGATAGQAGFTIEYPRETSEERIDIRGNLGTETGGHAYLLKDGSEVADAPIAGGRFVFRSVRLLPNSQNQFRVEAVDAREQPLGDQDFVVRHDEGALEGMDRLGAKITKPIRALDTRGYQVLFPEGLGLPQTRPFVCYRATSDDHIDIEFYEGDRQLSTLRVADVDRRLPIGAAIDLEITITDTYTVSAVATVRDTRQAANAEFKIERLQIPTLQEMDQDLAATLEQIENDLGLVRDMNHRVAFSSRCDRLSADYAKARRALRPDMHKLYSTIGELRTLLVEIRGAQTLLEPPFEQVMGLAEVCRVLAGKLPTTAVLKNADVVSRIASLKTAAQLAWEQEDAPEWKRLAAEFRKLHDEVRRAIEDDGDGGRRREPPSPQALQRGLQQWLTEIREKVNEHKLAREFGAEIDALERELRAPDLRDADAARNALYGVLEERLRPLDVRVDRAIADAGGTARATRAKVTFERG